MRLYFISIAGWIDAYNFGSLDTNQNIKHTEPLDLVNESVFLLFLFNHFSFECTYLVKFIGGEILHQIS